MTRSADTEAQAWTQGRTDAADEFLFWGPDAPQPVIVWLREVDSGTDNACWVVCAKGDPGAFPFGPTALAKALTPTEEGR